MEGFWIAWIWFWAVTQPLALSVAMAWALSH